MKVQQVINEIKFEEDFEDCNAQDVINASNIPDRRFQFYSKLYSIRELKK